MKQLKLYRLLFLIPSFILVFQSEAIGEERFTRKQYIDKWKDVAIQNMQAYGIPASITLAQAILESGDGNSMLARQANNHFGIKCHGWEGKRVYKDDDKKNECFRKYKDAMESFKDHSEFLQKNRYKSLYDLNPLDYKGWAKGLKKAGYATNPRYAKLLISIIEKHKLYEYDANDILASKNEEKSKKNTSKSSKHKEVTIEIEAHKRDVLTHQNKIKYVIAQKGDNLQSIAEEMDMAPWQIKRYNDLDGRSNFIENEVIFVQPKRNKSKSSYHIVEHGENMYDLSQKYGVKIKKLYHYNGLSPGDKLLTGMKLWLQRPPPT